MYLEERLLQVRVLSEIGAALGIVHELLVRGDHPVCDEWEPPQPAQSDGCRTVQCAGRLKNLATAARISSSLPLFTVAKRVAISSASFLLEARRICAVALRLPTLAGLKGGQVSGTASISEVERVLPVESE